MSSVLKRKRKPMEPVGFTKKEIAETKDAMARLNHTAELMGEAVLNVRLIAYQILHDKFGFGKKRIMKVDETIDKYIQKVTAGKVTETGLMFLLKEKYNIDVKAEANKVPFRERFALTKRKFEFKSQQSAGIYILVSICHYFAFLGVCLKTQFQFSKRQIEKAYFHIRDYINTLSRFEQFELKIEHIAESVAEECKFIDKRFVGGSSGA